MVRSDKNRLVKQLSTRQVITRLVSAYSFGAFLVVLVRHVEDPELPLLEIITSTRNVLIIGLVPFLLALIYKLLDKP